MTKRALLTVGLMMLATPVMLVGCGDGEEGTGAGGAGGTGGLQHDGAAGAGGALVDAGQNLDVLPPSVDSGVPVDLGTAADAPLQQDVAPPQDVNAIDTSIVDTGLPVVDAPALDTTAVDATPAIDTAPPVCTETTKFTGGAITTTRTLTRACSPYHITQAISVDGNATLVIEPGVTLRFDPDTFLAIGYSSAGKLTAVGTILEPITFTSSNTTPGAGDWAGVQLWMNTMNGTSLGYLKLDYCGSNGDACLLGNGVKPSRVTVDHVTIAHVGPGSDGIREMDTDSNFAISNCTFNNIPVTPTLQYAITVYAPSFVGIDSTNVFNGGAMVQVMGGTLSTTTTWKNVGTTVAVTSDLGIGGTVTPTLTLAAGSMFKFAVDTGIDVGYADPGKLVVAGTATSMVTLASLAATPAAGDWKGITVWYNSKATLSYATVSNAGSDTNSGAGAVSVISNTSALDVENSTIASSATYGIGVPCGSTATVTNTGNTFTAVASGDIGPGPDANAPACQ
jgi:hypothetical protein